MHICSYMNISHFKMLKAGGLLVAVHFFWVFLFCFLMWEFIIILYTDFKTVHSSGWNDFQTGEKKWYLYLLSLDPMLMRSSESTLWTIAALYPALCAFKTCKAYKVLIRKTAASKYSNLSSLRQGTLSRSYQYYHNIICTYTTSPFKIKSYNYSHTHVITLFFQKNHSILTADRQLLQD